MGEQPDLTKREPWDIINAFVEATNRAADAREKDTRGLQMMPIQEEYLLRRMREKNKLDVDAYGQQKAIDEPYQVRSEDRRLGRDKELEGIRTENNIRQGVETYKGQSEFRERLEEIKNKRARGGKEARPPIEGEIPLPADERSSIRRYQSDPNFVLDRVINQEGRDGKLRGYFVFRRRTKDDAPANPGEEFGDLRDEAVQGGGPARPTAPAPQPAPRSEAPSPPAASARPPVRPSEPAPEAPAPQGKKPQTWWEWLRDTDNTKQNLERLRPSKSSVESDEPPARMQRASSDLDSQEGLITNIYAALRNQGYSHEGSKAVLAEIGRENSFNPKLIFGSHTDPHKPNSKTNMGLVSWQGPRRNALMRELHKEGLLQPNGHPIKSPESLNVMARFMAQEMPRYNEGSAMLHEYLQQDDVDYKTAALGLGTEYIQWRYRDPKYFHHHGFRDNWYKKASMLLDAANRGGGNTPMPPARPSGRQADPRQLIMNTPEPLDFLDV